MSLPRMIRPSNSKSLRPVPRSWMLSSARTRHVPYSQYGKWMDAAAEFRAADADRDGDEVKAANDELNAFAPRGGCYLWSI